MEDQAKRAQLLGEVVVVTGRVREWQALVAMATAGIGTLTGQEIEQVPTELMDGAAWVVGPLIDQIVQGVEPHLDLKGKTK